MDIQRIAGAVCIGLTGIALLVVAALQVVAGVSNVVGIVIVGLTAVLGAAFTATGPIAYRADIQSSHLLRVAGWNTLGIAATGLVLALVFQYQAATDGQVTSPLLSGGIVVGVSAFAHVLIGFNDVRRIRARTVARQRQKAAVMNRFVRHDLKHTAQLLMGHGARLSGDDITEEELATLGEQISDIADELSETQGQISVIDDLLGEDQPTHSVDIRAIASEAGAACEEAYPDASLETDLPEDLTALGGKHVETAVTELVDNAFEHGGAPPEVSIRGSRTSGNVQLEVLDNGDGIPDHEQALIAGDRTETQLQHSSGLGLWLAKWIVKHYDGSLSIAEREDDDGSVVTMRLPAGG
jgi:signal transduction histidine kinase